MANYTPTFTKPYPSGWVDKPSKTTPATAAIMNSYDTAIAALEAYLRDNAIDTVSVSLEQFPSDGREWLGTITVGSNQYRIYMPSLKYENSVSDGIKIGTITLGEQSFDVYAPKSSAGGSTVSVVPKTLTGTNIAEITVDGTTYQLYAPTSGGGSGSTVTAEATLTEGTQIGKITIDGVETILYAPTASAITVDAELSATSENPVQNKVVKAEFDKVDSNLTNLKVSDVAGGKNLFTLKDKEIHTDNVKYEVINENSVSITSNDNCPNNQWVQIVVKNIKVKKNTDYVLSIGNVSNALSDTMCAVVRTDTSVTVGSMYNVQSNALIKFHVSDYDNVFIILRHSQNDSSGASNHTIIWSNIQLEEGTQATDYEPYIPSVKMLADENAQQNDSISSLGKCKNLLKPILRTTTLNDVNCTYNGDGTYTLKGTATATTYFNFILNYNFKKDTKIIGCPHNGSADSFGIFIYNVIGGYDYGDGFIFKEDKTTRAGIYIKSGYTCNNLVFKPMLTTNLNATYDDFVPYTGDGDTLTADVAKIESDVSDIKDGTTPVAKAVADEDGNNIKNTYATKAELPSAPSSLYETVNVDIITDLFEKSITQNYVSCERVGNICTLSFWLQATANVDHKHRHELFDIDKIPKNNLTIGFCVVNFNGSVSNSANDAYNYINSISVEQYYNSILKRNISRVYLLPYHTDHVVMSSGNDFIGQISWVVEA